VSAFFDTNVVVYAYDAADQVKRARAQALIEQHGHARTLVLSTQVLQEAYAVLVRKRIVAAAVAADIVAALAAERVVPADADSVLRGIACAQRHRLALWDGLIVQAALDAGCAVLYSEDLQAGQRFGEMEVVNPFTDAARQTSARYAAPTRRATALPRKGTRK
jgi:predicted nucleic acid-binding protein